jgi:hypothetical protein
MDIAAKPKSSREIAEAAAKQREKELNDAVERVYRQYGQDLDAFNRDVQRDLELVKRT